MLNQIICLLWLFVFVINIVGLMIAVYMLAIYIGSTYLFVIVMCVCLITIAGLIIAVHVLTIYAESTYMCVIASCV